MADDRQDEATFQFIDEVHNCPALWDISSPAYKDTKNKQKKMEEIVQITFETRGISFCVKLLDERIVRAKGRISA